MVLEKGVEDCRSEDYSSNHKCLDFCGFPWVMKMLLVGNLMSEPAMPLIPRMPPKSK